MEQAIYAEERKECVVSIGGHKQELTPVGFDLMGSYSLALRNLGTEFFCLQARVLMAEPYGQR